MAIVDAFADLPELFCRLGTVTNPTKDEHNAKHDPEPIGVGLTHLDEEAASPKPREDQYVLLLIDANSHTFTEELVATTHKHVDGSKLRDHFYSAVQAYFSTMDLHFGRTCRVVVRAFTDLEAVAKEPTHSLLSFVACFSSADPFFDLNIVQNSEIVENKITETYKSAVKDRSCKHIFVAAWRRPSYLCMLNTTDDKTAIVEGSSMRMGFDQLPLQIPFARFSQIFKGPDTSESTSPFPQADVTVHTQALSTGKRPGRLVGPLPHAKKGKQGYVPINKHGQRLDVYFQYPKKAVREEFHKRFPPGTKQPCNWHLLANNCPDTGPCPYDHSEVTENILLYRRFQTSIIPCAEGSKCRRSECFFGHLCRRQNCTNGDVEGCTMREFHQVDPKIALWVKGTATDQKVAQKDITHGITCGEVGVSVALDLLLVLCQVEGDRNAQASWEDRQDRRTAKPAIISTG